MAICIKCIEDGVERTATKGELCAACDALTTLIAREVSLCERCDERNREREGIYRVERDMVLCDSCETIENEQAHEAFLDDYYGGSGCVTLKEQYDAAAKQKRADR